MRENKKHDREQFYVSPKVSLGYTFAITTIEQFLTPAKSPSKMMDCTIRIINTPHIGPSILICQWKSSLFSSLRISSEIVLSLLLIPISSIFPRFV